MSSAALHSTTSSVDVILSCIFTSFIFIFGFILTDTVHHAYCTQKDEDDTDAVLTSFDVTNIVKGTTFTASVAIVLIAAYQQSIQPVLNASYVYYIAYALIFLQQTVAGWSIAAADFLREPLIFCIFHAGLAAIWCQLDEMNSFF